MSKVCVFGPSGMLGRQVVRVLHEQGHTPVPVYRQLVQLTDRHSVERNLEGCDAVINCAGLIPVKSTNMVDMIHANSVFPHILVSCGLPTILVSTDCVFSGKSNRRYTVRDLPDPKDYYGRSKSLGEVVAPNSLVVRTSFIGCEHGFMSWILGAGTIASATGVTQQVMGWKNALWTGSTVTAVAASLVDMLQEFEPGTAHLSTEQTISKFDLAVKLVEFKQLDLTVVPSMNPIQNRALEPTHLLPDIDTALANYKCSGAGA